MNKLMDMTDEELIKTLKQYGIKHGPIVDTTRPLYEKKIYEYERTKTTIPASANTTQPLYEKKVTEYEQRKTIRPSAQDQLLNSSSYAAREKYRDYNPDNSTVIAQTPANTSPGPNIPQELVSVRAAHYVPEIQQKETVVNEKQADVMAGLGASLSKLAAAQERLSFAYERLASSQERLASAQEKQNALMEGMLSALPKLIQAQSDLGQASGVDEPVPQASSALAPSATEATCGQVHPQGPKLRSKKRKP